jgi:hypothetical protein
MDKAHFLRHELVPAIAGITPDRNPSWGKMNLQQMTEHMAREGFCWASGKVPHQLITPEEHIPKLQAFIMSDKPFRENTLNSLMPEEPLPAEHKDMPAALAALQEEINHFFAVFEQHPDKKVMNPFFGELDHTLSVHLLYKHSLHHLKQFGVTL